MFPLFFEAVLLNGVFGCGVDRRAAMSKALRSIAAVLPPGGLLLIGWDHGRCCDPLELTEARELFEPFAAPPLTGRTTFSHSIHVYDLVRRRELPPD